MTDSPIYASAVSPQEALSKAELRTAQRRLQQQQKAALRLKPVKGKASKIKEEENPHSIADFEEFNTVASDGKPMTFLHNVMSGIDWQINKTIRDHKDSDLTGFNVPGSDLS